MIEYKSKTYSNTQTTQQRIFVKIQVDSYYTVPLILGPIFKENFKNAFTASH